jgi:hypothetical protein
METYVYLYKDENGTPIYVGIGTGYRAWSHLKPSAYMPYDAEYPSFYGKIKKMYLNGNEPKVEIIYSGDRLECISIEEKLIQKYGRVENDGTLYNISPKTGGRIKGKSYPMGVETLKRYRNTCKENRKYKIYKENLTEMYIKNNMTRKEIAKYYGCSEILIKTRLKEYGIKKVNNE